MKIEVSRGETTGDDPGAWVMIDRELRESEPIHLFLYEAELRELRSGVNRAIEDIVDARKRRSRSLTVDDLTPEEISELEVGDHGRHETGLDEATR